MRDPFDVMTFFQTNMLCEAFTDSNKYNMSEHDRLLETKISCLFDNIEDMVTKEECNVIEKLNEVILNKKSNYRT